MCVSVNKDIKRHCRFLLSRFGGRGNTFHSINLFIPVVTKYSHRILEFLNLT